MFFLTIDGYSKGQMPCAVFNQRAKSNNYNLRVLFYGQ